MSTNPINRRAIIRRVLALGDLIAHDRLVMLALVERMRVEGKQSRQAWPRIEVIADDVNGDPQHVRKGLKRLEQAGQIQRWRLPRGYLYRVPPVWDEVPVASVRTRRLREPSTREIAPWE